MASTLLVTGFDPAAAPDCGLPQPPHVPIAPPDWLAGLADVLPAPRAFAAQGMEDLKTVIALPPAMRGADLFRLARERKLRLPTPAAFVTLPGGRCRGRFGRRWETAEGNLAASVLFDIRLPARSCAGLLPVAAGVAVAETVATLLPAGPAPELRWINDVFVCGKKVAGILTYTTLAGGIITQALVGVGINLCIAPPVPRTPFLSQGTGALSQYCADATPTATQALNCLTVALARQLGRLPIPSGRLSIVRDVYRHTRLVGRRVRLYEDGEGLDEQSLEGRPYREGVLTGFSEEGNIYLDGREDEPYNQGRLLVCPWPPTV